MRVLCLLFFLCAACGSGVSGDDPADADASSTLDVSDLGESDTAPCRPPSPYTPHAILDIPAPDGSGPRNLADPVVIKVDDTWYLYATEQEPAYRAWASTDLVTWEDRGPAWTPTAGTWNAEGGTWAPHVMAGDDGYYLYYTADEMIGVAWSASPEGPFEEIYDHPLLGGGYGGIGDGVFEHPDGSFPGDYEEHSIDAFVLVASDGSLTMYATQHTPANTIIAMPMADLRTVIHDEMVVIAEPDFTSWEGFINEGPWVNETDGRFVLTYSGFGADQAGYSLGVAVADSPLGPFEKSPGNPFLSQDPDRGFYGPGHHSIVEGFCGDLLFFYHTKVSPEQGWERRLRYAPLVFDGVVPVLPPVVHREKGDRGNVMLKACRSLGEWERIGVKSRG